MPCRARDGHWVAPREEASKIAKFCDNTLLYSMTDIFIEKLDKFVSLKFIEVA